MFNLIFELFGRSFNGTTLLRKNGDSDNVTRDTASSTEVSLLANVYIRNVLIFTQQWQVHDDFKRFSVSSKDDKISDTSVQGFGSFISTFLEKFEVLGLVHEIQASLLHLVVSKRVCSGHVLFITSVRFLVNKLWFSLNFFIGVRVLLLFLLILLFLFIFFVLLRLLVFLNRFL